MAQLRITQRRSGIGGTANQRETLKTLGLRRIGASVVREDRPEVLGMVRMVNHLVQVESVTTTSEASGGDTDD
jgi:large subunit ribosomal protein L30